jgi:hypothetical protein
MKDRQIPLSGAEPRIPFVSDALHCITMTVLVFLRSSFGFVYLRPKSVFFAFTWAFVLFTIYAWNEPDVWRQYSIVCLFGIVAAGLYWIHLGLAFTIQWTNDAQHDRYSGTSHPLRFLRFSGISRIPGLERILHLWIEPLCVLLAALVLRVLFREQHLSTWLLIVAPCFWFKEVLNVWFELRHRKRQRDMFDDASETTDPAAATGPHHGAPKATRKEQVRRKRNSALAEESARERHFAELLRLREPYSLETAEEHYRTLVRMEHPDANDGSPESTARTAELNEAVEFFREKLSA